MVDSKFVLVAEDDPFAQQVAKMQLTNIKVPFDIGKDGLEAYNKFEAKAGSVTLVLMDLTMPNMDGFQSAIKIRDLEKSKGYYKCKIYAISADNDQATKDKVIEVGMDGLIVKPLNIAKINEIL